jgi:hypothetical protein
MMNEAVLYSNEEQQPVLVGDMVESRVWFVMKRKGQVVYVPGISEFHKDMEFNGIRYVGWRTAQGVLFSTPVNPSSNRVLRLKLLNRATLTSPEISPGDTVEDEA